MNYFNKQEDDVIKQNYPTHGPKFCAEIINKDVLSITRRANRLGVKRDWVLWSEQFVGCIFGFSTVIEILGRNKHNHMLCKSRCNYKDCKNEFVTELCLLRKGNTKSCGCYAKNTAIINGQKSKTHGECSRVLNNGKKASKEYKTWSSIMSRCYNPKSTSYKYYGGRGIKVCDKWLDSFESFLIDLGRAPSIQHSLDRINNNGNYEPENCRWATKKEQIKNRRKFQCIEGFSDEEILNEFVKRGLHV